MEPSKLEAEDLTVLVEGAPYRIGIQLKHQPHSPEIERAKIIAYLFHSSAHFLRGFS
jgi:hypothetical protein